MSPGTANRLWTAWSLILIAATIAALWFSTSIAPGFDGQDVLAPLRSRVELLESTKARIEPATTQLKESAEELSRIARRQLPRPPFGLAEPPFVQEMRQREEALLATLTGVRDQLRASNQQLLDLQQEIKEADSAMKSDLDAAEHRIELLQETLATKSAFLAIALAFIAAGGALSILVSAWRGHRRAQRDDPEAAKQ